MIKIAITTGKVDNRIVNNENNFDVAGNDIADFDNAAYKIILLFRNKAVILPKDFHWQIINHRGPFIKYVRKIFRKTIISNPLIRTRTCAYQGVRNVSSENFAYILNGWPLIVISFLKKLFLLITFLNNIWIKCSWCSRI